MRKTLLATTALAAAGAFAAGPVLAADMADKLTVGVGGYMEQWIGVSSLDNHPKGHDGGVSQYSDSEIFFKGSLEADNGLKFSVKVELEGNTHADVIDESQATVSGSFGQFVIGSEDDPATLMHYGNKDVGVGLNCGDPGFLNGLMGCARSGGVGLGTSGHLIGGDSQKVAYYTPRMEGVQFGISYSPESVEDSGAGAPIHNDHEAVSLGLNYMGGIGDVSIALSAGYFDKSQTIPMPETAKTYGADGTGEEVELATEKAYPGTKIDAQTFANFGLQVGFGAFGFDVAYAEHDGGHYKMMENDDGDMVEVKNGAADYEVVSAGVNYSDGPMAVSLSHMMAEADDDSEANATMFSFSYTLAPGIASKSTLMAGEKGDMEGTAIVTGITLSF